MHERVFSVSAGESDVSQQPSIETIVGEIQALRAAGQPSAGLEGELIRRMGGVVRRVASRYLSGAGSLELADLEQIARISVIRSVNTFRCDGPMLFAAVASYRMRREVLEQVRLHGQAVNVSEHARKSGSTERVYCQPMSPEPNPDADDECRDWSEWAPLPEHRPDRDAVDPTPEDVLESAQLQALVRRELYQLPAQMRDAVASVYGVGRPEVSVRELSRRLNVHRKRLDALVAEGLDRIRREVESETD